MFPKKNMEEKLLKILKEMRQIQPNSDYSRNSKMLILASNKSVPAQAAGFNIFNKFNVFNKLTVSSATVAILSVVLVAGYYFNSTNKNEVIARANEINASIQVKLTEIQYLLNHRTDAAGTVNDVQILLIEAATSLEEAEKLITEEETEEAFDKIKKAQEIFVKIDDLVRQ